MSDAVEGAPGEFVYGYRARMIGAGATFRLGEHSLEWNVSGLSGRAAYPMIRMIRLGYRPSNFGSRRFVAEIWPRNAARLEIASASYRSMVAMEDQGLQFKTFIRELHRRIAASGANCRFEAGFAPWRWWPMFAVGAATGLALIYLAFHTLLSGDFAAGLLVLGFILLSSWQMLPLILRNRPRSYDPHNIPKDVLP